MTDSKIVLSWYGGPKSMMTLHFLKQMNSNVQLFNGWDQTSHVILNAVSQNLFRKQALAFDCRLDMIEPKASPLGSSRNVLFSEQLKVYKCMGLQEMAFDDVYLLNSRDVKEQKLLGSGISPVFPIWGTPPVELMQQFIELQYKAIVYNVDTEKLDKSFCGRALDLDFLNDLPSGVDSCGENGEFNAFVFDGPLFQSPIDFGLGQGNLREGRYYVKDLLD